MERPQFNIAAWMLLAIPSLANAQMAGLVTYSEGTVTIDGEAPAASPELHVLDGQDIAVVDGKAEMMLIPHTALRVGPQSSVEMVDAGFSSAHLKALSGTVVVDLPVSPGPDAIVVEATPYQVSFQRSGEYWMQKTESGWRVIVLKGQASIDGEGVSYKIKAKRASTLDGSQTVTKLGKGEEPDDAFAEWRRARGEKVRKAIPASMRDAKEKVHGLEQLRTMGTP